MNAGAQTNPANDAAQPKQRMIHSCNFRYAGRLSNENARTLTSLHEKFALHVTNALQVYLGAEIRLRLVSLEQMATQDYVAKVGPQSYLAPCALNVLQSSMLMEMDTMLVFPMIDLLLGGVGDVSPDARDLTDIDEEIMESVTAILLQEVERSWRALNLTLVSGRCIRPAGIPQIFPANEKLVLLMFEMEVAQTSGHFTIVLPASFVGFLLRNLQAAQSKKMAGLRHLPAPSLRERILDGKFLLASDMTQMRVLVKDLASLQVGSVLKLNAPVKSPGRLTVENVDLFEASPVRSGALKASQVTVRLLEPTVGKAMNS